MTVENVVTSKATRRAEDILVIPCEAIGTVNEVANMVEISRGDGCLTILKEEQGFEEASLEAGEGEAMSNI